jgi:hypothetical protein
MSICVTNHHWIPLSVDAGNVCDLGFQVGNHFLAIWFTLKYLINEFTCLTIQCLALSFDKS